MRKPVKVSNEVFDSIELGVQKPPEDYRIFKGTMAGFFDSAIIAHNNEKAEPERLPLESCPEVRDSVCYACFWYDGDKAVCCS